MNPGIRALLARIPEAMTCSGQSGCLALDGCTRGGSPGIFG